MRYLKYYLIGLVGTLQEVALCEIQNAQIKEASKSFISTMNDWSPAVIGGGLLVSGILIFANNYKSGLSGIAATAFIYAAKAFTGTGEGTLLSSIDLLCR